MKLSLLLAIAAAFPGRCLAQNPVCCACGGPEPCPPIVNPDFIIELPDDPNLPAGLPSQVTCSLLQQAGETLLLISAAQCIALEPNLPEVRDVCCGLTASPTTAPTPTPPPPPPPACSSNFGLLLLQVLFGWNLGWLFGFTLCTL